MPVKPTGNESIEFQTLALAAAAAFIVQAAREWTRDNPEKRPLAARLQRTFSLAALSAAVATVAGGYVVQTMTVTPLALYTLGGVVGMLGVNAYEALAARLAGQLLGLKPPDPPPPADPPAPTAPDLPADPPTADLATPGGTAHV